MSLTTIDTKHPVRRHHKRPNELEFRLIAGLAFAVFLVVVTAARVLPAGLREKLLGLSAGASVIGDARALADATVPFAFMA